MNASCSTTGRRALLTLLASLPLPAAADTANGPDPYAPGFGFDTPSTASNWGGWTRGAAGTVYAEWDTFSDASHGTASDRTAAPGLGSQGATDAHLSWNSGTFVAGSGNLYSFTVDEVFGVDLTPSSALSGTQTIALQIETWGNPLDTGSLLLNGTAPASVTRTYTDPAFPSSMGEVNLDQWLVLWNPPAASAYRLDFGASVHTALAQVAVDIGPRNHPPTASAGGDQMVYEDGSVILQGSGTDPDSDPISYQWTQIEGPTVVLSDAASPTPGFTAPAVNADTLLSFRLVVTDAKGLPSDAAETRVTVLDRDSRPPGAPFAEAGADQSVQVGATVVLDGSASGDPEGQALSYQWTQLAGPPVTLSDATAAKPQFTAPPVNANTVLTFQLVVTDADGNAADPDTVNVAVNRHNQAPVADPGAPSTIRAGAVKVLGGQSYDPDGDPLTYLWTQTDGPAVELSSTTAANPSFVAPADAVGQTLGFSLSVSDGHLESDPQAVTVAVVANSAPTVDAGTSQVFGPNAQVILNSTASDPDGDTLAYAWEQIGGPMVVLSGADTPSPSFTAPAVAEGTAALEFRLTVNDRYEPDPLSATDTVRVLVSHDGRALDCSHAVPSRGTLWPAQRGMVKVRIAGVTGPDPYRLAIIGITQDEPVRNPALKDRTRPDARIVTPKATRKNPLVKDYALLRAERQGLRKKRQPFSGNGRVYELRFTADDGVQACEGSVRVQVPPARGGTAVDDGQAHDATRK